MAENEAPQPELESETQVLTRCLAELQRIAPASRARILRTLSTFFSAETPTQQEEPRVLAVHPVVPPQAPSIGFGFRDGQSISPKQFLLDKKPRTDIERVACLAFYLTHYRGQAEFKTADLSALNTEAAAIRLSNPAYAVDNAGKAGLLVRAPGGQKQLSAIGELYVQTLPDSERARAVIADHRPKRRRSSSQPGPQTKDE